MKKIITLLLLVLSAQAMAQNNPITAINISLPANPDANTANWGTGTSLLNIKASVNGRLDALVQESKILVTIKKGGNKVCGSYASNSAPSAGFKVATQVWDGADAVALLGEGCTLPPGDYELSVQFFSVRGGVGVPLSQETTKAFSIKGNEQQTFRDKTNVQMKESAVLSLGVVSPANGATISAEMQPRFTWTPVIPRPTEPVAYKIKIVEIVGDQSPEQAIHTNKPIFEKDSLASSAFQYPLNGPVLIPGKKYGWAIEANKKLGAISVFTTQKTTKR
ncbi:hypothetical protein EWM62_07175 [Mucilaginibacter terrigena]|uniref:DUF4198 domain-containing protein n=1 Tax=Mucilaginibacter terrigena TaxID=2492395 RepID=A0A4Q5LQI8_9SPHI|nr:hypothetical protein [Mucilaginibacter terrigena]RYU91712.1 hypothetical protein EWM62_07175 [Mucilaginibacter terrigena]